MQEDKNSQQVAEQAGNVISPGGAVQPAQSSSPVPTQAVQDPTQASSKPAAPADTQLPENTPNETENTTDNNPQIDPEAIDEDEASYSQEDDQLQEDDSPVTTHQEVSWLGSEYIHHEKSGAWFMALFGIAVLAAGLVFLVTRDFITSGMIVFCAFIFGVFSRREPKQIQYSVSDNGIVIDDKSFSYKQFKSFSVAQEGAIENIILRPVKRFDTYKTIYCAPEQLDQIVEIMSSHMAMDDHAPDAVDKLMLKVRF